MSRAGARYEARRLTAVLLRDAGAKVAHLLTLCPMSSTRRPFHEGLRSVEATRWSRPVLSGVLLGLSYPPFPFWPLAWVALVPLLQQWRTAATWRQAYQDAAVTFGTTFAVAFWWPLCHALPETALLSVSGLLALPLLLALPWALAWPVYRRRGAAPGGAVLVCGQLALELALSRGPLAFPWPLLGHTQAEAFAFNAFADLTGVAGLSGWVFLLNLCVLYAWPSGHKRRRHAVGALLLLLLVPYSYRLLRPTPAPYGFVNAALVQPSLPPAAWAQVYDAGRVHLLTAMSDSLLEATDVPLDLLVWPETALPVHDGVRQKQRYDRLQRWVDRHGVPLLTGAITTADDHRAYRNTALLFRPGHPRQAYHKAKLVPFAEQVPFADRWPWLKRLAFPSGGVAGYQPGTEQPVLVASGAAFGVLICFESLFGAYAARYADRGAGFFVTLTQDGWWGRTFGYRQHLAFNRLRAIASRRALVQVAATGTTALLLPDGTSAFETPWMARTTRTARIPLHHTRTLYTRHGDWLSHLALAALLGLSLYALLTPARRPPASLSKSP